MKRAAPRKRTSRAEADEPATEVAAAEVAAEVAAAEPEAGAEEHRRADRISEAGSHDRFEALTAQAIARLTEEKDAGRFVRKRSGSDRGGSHSLPCGNIAVEDGERTHANTS